MRYSLYSASQGRKVWSTNIEFQDIGSKQRRSPTIDECGSRFGDTNLHPFSSGNHRWSQIRILRPFHTLYVAPLVMTSLASKILFHSKELLGLSLASRMLPFGKYLAWKTICRRVFLSWNNLHPCLPSRASLNNLKSLKPIPPTDFEEQRMLHLSQCIFLCLPLMATPKLSYHGFNILTQPYR